MQEEGLNGYDESSSKQGYPGPHSDYMQHLVAPNGYMQGGGAVGSLSKDTLPPVQRNTGID